MLRVLSYRALCFFLMPCPGTPTSRYVRGVEIIDSDLDCLRRPQCRINGTVLNAYASLAPDQDKCLTRAGCVILSSLVPYFVKDQNNSCDILEKYIASVVSTSIPVWTFELYDIMTRNPDIPIPAACMQALGISAVWRTSGSLGFGLGELVSS